MGLYTIVRNRMPGGQFYELNKAYKKALMELNKSGRREKSKNC